MKVRGLKLNLSCLPHSNGSTTAASPPTKSAPPKFDNTTTSGGAKPTSFVSATYFENWGIYNASGIPSFFPEDLPVNELTHVIYAFADIYPGNATLNITDGWSDVGAGPDGTTPNGTAQGNVLRLFKLKQKHPNLKVLLSIGGWTASANFIEPASTAEGRATLAKSAVATMGDYGFDGIDLDWEHMVYDSKFNQSADYVKLLEACRLELDAYAKANAPGYHFELTVASPGAAHGVAEWDVKGMAQYLDRFNVMSYDFAGSWSNVSSHHANLYPSEDKNVTVDSVDAGVQAYLDAGVPASKLLLGVPTYARTFIKTEGLGKPSNGSMPQDNTTGVSDGGGVPYRIIKLNTTTKVEYDEKLGAAWTYDASTKVFSSFDDVRVTAQKARYVKEKGLAGMFSWTGRWDKPSGPESLNTAWVKELGKLVESKNLQSFPKSKYPNIANPPK